MKLKKIFARQPIARKHNIKYTIFGGTLLGAGLLTRSYLNSTKEVIKKMD